MDFGNQGRDRKDSLRKFDVNRRRVLSAVGGGIGGLSVFTESATAKPDPLRGVRVETVATNLDVPWGATFRDETLYVTERAGRIVRINDGSREVIADFTDETVEGESERGNGTSGLCGLVFHPWDDDIAYTYQTYRRSDGNINNRVLKHDVEDDFAYEVLFDGIPGSHWQNGGRLLIDGEALYVTTGQGEFYGDPQPSARDPTTLNGSILRLTLNGEPYPTNPFAEGEEGHPAVYTYGHRNPEGIALRRTGQLFITEHEPSHDDEINLLKAGNDYGWPTVMGPSDDESITDPVTSYTPTIAIAGATFYYGPISRWRGSFFFVTLKDKTLYRLRFSHSNDPNVVQQERLLGGEYGLLRSTFIGPKGNLYVTTSNRDGSPDAEVDPKSDVILRLVPKKGNGPPFGDNNNSLLGGLLDDEDRDENDDDQLLSVGSS